MVAFDIWAARTPDLNYDLLVLEGTGPASTLAAGGVYAAELAMIESLFGASVANAVATSLQWSGFGGAASNATVTSLNTAEQLLAAWVAEKLPVIMSAVTAYTMAASTMIPSIECRANRVEEAHCQCINPMVLGALTPNIIELNMRYFGGYWPTNSSAGLFYGSTLTGLTTALSVPPPIAPLGVNPALPAVAAATVAETASTTAAGEALEKSSDAAMLTTSAGQKAVSAPGEMGSQVSSLMGPMQSVVGMVPQLMQAPMQLMQLPMQALSPAQSLIGMFSSLKPQDTAMATAAMPERLPVGSPLATSTAGLPAGAVSSLGAGPGGYPASGLTNFTRPTSNFTTETVGGRPSSLPTGLLSATESRPPTTAMGGAPMMPMAPGMLGRQGEAEQDRVTHARIVLPGEHDPR